MGIPEKVTEGGNYTSSVGYVTYLNQECGLHPRGRRAFERYLGRAFLTLCFYWYFPDNSYSNLTSKWKGNEFENTDIPEQVSFYSFCFKIPVTHVSPFLFGPRLPSSSCFAYFLLPQNPHINSAQFLILSRELHFISLWMSCFKAICWPVWEGLRRDADWIQFLI